MKRVIILFLLATLCLALFGCTSQPPMGEISSDKFARCAITSNHTMAETDLGFYSLFTGYLYYADKSDLTKWLPVCSKPNCTHDLKSPDCDANMSGSGFQLYHDRIYLCESYGLYEKGHSGTVLVSMPISGGERKLEHVVFNSDQQGSNRQWRNCFLHDRIVLFYSYMNSSGVFENYAAQYTSEGIQILAEGHSENIPRFLGTVTASEYVGGDPAVLYNLDDSGFGTVLYRFTETGLEPIGDTAGLGLGTLASCDMAGAYLTGDILQVYRPNDGYYDINLATGEQTKTMDVQMEDGWGWHLTDQYILESPLLFNRPEQQLEMKDGPHAMLFYDGESWNPVTLPKELTQATGAPWLTPLAVSSDRVFFTFSDVSNPGHTRLYQLLLNEEAYQLTFLTSYDW